MALIENRPFNELRVGDSATLMWRITRARSIAR